jgi:hypothetical protein
VRVTELNDESDEGGRGSESKTHFLFNTNLLKVSDWLTTILIGLGLVQLGNLIPAVASFATILSEPLGGTDFGPAVCIGLMMTNGIAALMVGYVWVTTEVVRLYKEEWAGNRTLPGVAPRPPLPTPSLPRPGVSA